MNFLNRFLPKKEAILNKEAIMEDMPKMISKAIYPKEVMEIHHEFETAADKLLQEAASIIAEAATKDTTKINRLEALGFKQAGQVTELRPLLQKAELSKEQVELVNYYKRNYPFNKFITEEQVKAICYKYNLVCGDVDRFKGFVPEKNLREIERFELKKNDYSYMFSYTKKESYSDEFMNETQAKAFVERRGWTWSDLMRVEKSAMDRFSTVMKVKQKLQICAPVKDMDISGLELIEGYKLEKKHIPDPVVLQPVNGGYIILAAWGDEASDPLVVNEINN
jgi:hypothetical protein